MALMKMPCAVGSGGSNEPLVIYQRGNHSQVWCCLNNEIVQRYKYIRLISKAEASAYISATMSSMITIETAQLDINTDMASVGSTITLSTTDVLISSLNLDVSKFIAVYLNGVSGWSAFALLLHD